LPQRGGAVVPSRREQLRQLHGAPIGQQQARIEGSVWSGKAPPRRGFLLRAPSRSVSVSAGGNQHAPKTKTRPGRPPCNVASSCAPPASVVAQSSPPARLPHRRSLNQCPS